MISPPRVSQLYESSIPWFSRTNDWFKQSFLSGRSTRTIVSDDAPGSGSPPSRTQPRLDPSRRISSSIGKHGLQAGNFTGRFAAHGRVFEADTWESAIGMSKVDHPQQSSECAIPTASCSIGTELYSHVSGTSTRTPRLFLSLVQSRRSCTILTPFDHTVELNAAIRSGALQPTTRGVHVARATSRPASPSRHHGTVLAGIPTQGEATRIFTTLGRRDERAWWEDIRICGWKDGRQKWNAARLCLTHPVYSTRLPNTMFRLFHLPVLILLPTRQPGAPTETPDTL